MASPERTVLSGPALRERAALALRVPIAQALGFGLLDDTDPTAGAALTAGDLALNGAGGVHASALAALLETAGYLALLPALGTDEHAVTHSVSLHLVRAIAAGARVEARGEVDRRTGRMAFVSARALVGDDVVARAQLVKSIVPFTSP